MRTTRITITRVESPSRKEPDVNTQLQYLGQALGLFGQRDKDSSRFRIFIAILRSTRKHSRGLSSDELAELAGLSRATVIHHLNSLMDAGIIDHSRGRYELRVENLEELVERIRQDVNKTFDELSQLARHCDSEMGLNTSRGKPL